MIIRKLLEKVEARATKMIRDICKLLYEDRLAKLNTGKEEGKGRPH